MIAELFAWAPWAACTFGVLALWGLTLSIAERVVQAAPDDHTQYRVSRREVRR